MNFFEIVRFALRGISANRLRSSLTMLGILIGVAAVILLVAVGNGSARAITTRIEALGTSTLTVMSASRESGGLTTRIAEALDDPVLAPGVRSVSPVVSTSATLTTRAPSTRPAPSSAPHPAGSPRPTPRSGPVRSSRPTTRRRRAGSW
jgi:putative ABC transport system permease protein